MLASTAPDPRVCTGSISPSTQLQKPKGVFLVWAQERLKEVKGGTDQPEALISPTATRCFLVERPRILEG